MEKQQPLESKFRKKWLCQAFRGKPADYVQVKTSEKSLSSCTDLYEDTHEGEEKGKTLQSPKSIESASI